MWAGSFLCSLVANLAFSGLLNFHFLHLSCFFLVMWPLSFFLQISLVAQSVKYACNAGDPGSIPGRSPGEGNGNPLQYSCLENPMDRGAWWATVHGVTRVGYNWATKPTCHMEHTGRRDLNTGLAAEAHGLSCSRACGIFPDQRSNPCPLHWQADSYHLSPGKFEVIFQSLTVSLYFVAWGEVCPGAGIAPKGPRSQPVSEGRGREASRSNLILKNLSLFLCDTSREVAVGRGFLGEWWCRQRMLCFIGQHPFSSLWLV